MGLIKPMGQGQGFLKAGFLGFPKSGKTYTAALLACAVKEMMSAEGPIVLVDTENGSEYIAPLVRDLTGNDLCGIRTRVFDDLCSVGIEALQSKASVLIVDSITHIWRELMDAFLKRVNEQRAKRRLPPRTRFEFQDWGPLKGIWNDRWTTFYLNSAIHIIVCGRAGYEYDYELDEETGKKELRKADTKMKVETEFGFEPSLLVEMERADRKTGQARRAVVRGDRFGVIDGSVGEFPTVRGKTGSPDLRAHLAAVRQFFSPHLELLRPGAHSTVDTEVKSNLDVDEEGDLEYRRRKKEATILCEEIQHLLVKHYPSQKTEDKKAKIRLIEEAFETGSWTKVEGLSPGRLRRGLDLLRRKLEPDTFAEKARKAREEAEAVGTDERTALHGACASLLGELSLLEVDTREVTDGVDVSSMTVEDLRAWKEALEGTLRQARA